MQATSEQIVIALATAGIKVEWYSEPQADIYGTIEVTADVEIRVYPEFNVVYRFENGIEQEWYDQADTMGELINTVREALTDAN